MTLLFPVCAQVGPPIVHKHTIATKLAPSYEAVQSLFTNPQLRRLLDAHPTWTLIP